MNGVNKQTPGRVKLFLDTLGETGHVGKAIAAAGVDRTTAYKWRREDAAFAQEWELALQAGISVLEDEAKRRACEGWEEPVYYQGVEVGKVRKFSDGLLSLLLKCHDPRYREATHLTLANDPSAPVFAADDKAAAKIAVLLELARQRRDEGSDLAA